MSGTHSLAPQKRQSSFNTIRARCVKSRRIRSPVSLVECLSSGCLLQDRAHRGGASAGGPGRAGEGAARQPQIRARPQEVRARRQRRRWSNLDVKCTASSLQPSQSPLYRPAHSPVSLPVFSSSSSDSAEMDRYDLPTVSPMRSPHSYSPSVYQHQVIYILYTGLCLCVCLCVCEREVMMCEVHWPPVNKTVVYP